MLVQANYLSRHTSVATRNLQTLFESPGPSVLSTSKGKKPALSTLPSPYLWSPWALQTPFRGANGQKVWSKCCDSAEGLDDELFGGWRNEIDSLLVFVSGP